MKIAFFGDVHLPVFKETLPYKVLDWAMQDIQKKADCAIFVGDATCDGNEQTYLYFLGKMQSVHLPFLFIPGNSDLRDVRSKEKIKILSSPCENQVGEVCVYAVNDSDGEISEETYADIENAGEKDVVFMHHPISCLKKEHSKRMSLWRETHSTTKLFFGHLHRSKIEGFDYSLQALDPDKSIGEPPCITYYDTRTGGVEKSYFSAPLPNDLSLYLGISCYLPNRDIPIAIKHRLRYLELRPNCLQTGEEELLALLEEWRKNGGETLSVHLPDLGYKNGEVWMNGDLDKLLAFAEKANADRLVQHVPALSIREAERDKAMLEKIAEYLGNKLNSCLKTFTIGVENMHMKQGEKADGNRGFGYLPEECLLFKNILASHYKGKVGINFDIGHARNNPPYSQTYQIGSWLALVGKEAVSYHLHQVRNGANGFENHTAITSLYGDLISFASFFRLWSDGEIAKAPVILEIREENGYERTLEAFDKEIYG
jgi:predicted phosphodiesterase